MTDYKLQFQEDLELVNRALDNYMSLEAGPAQYMADAMEYSVAAGGKRLRPMLVLEFCRMCGGDPVKALPFACALELIHTSSLVHDDMPAMDNDEYRRGKLSTWKMYGENFGLLAGDALEMYAFQVASTAAVDPSVTLECIRILAEESGVMGMLGGQCLDEQNETLENVTVDRLYATHKRKTAALIQCACEMGCVAAGATAEQRQVARDYGEALGIAFQVEDDILDVVADETVLGKPVGSDAESNKATYVTLLGLEASREKAQDYTEKAYAALDAFEDNAFLKQLTKELLERDR